MKAVYIDEPGKITLREKETSGEIGEDQVRIRVKYTGICGSDMAIYRGDNPFVVYPRVFGHEFTGEVTETGKKVSDIRVGDHVVGEPIEYCGTCYACRNGHPNVCQKLQVYGVHLDGGCQTCITMPAARVHRISKDVPWKCAVLAEPMTIGFQSVWRGDVRQGDVVLVMGAGTAGLCVMMAAKHRGATVISTDLFDEKLEYARKLGADYVVNVSRCSVLEEVLKITDGMGANVVLDAVGTGESLETAIQAASTAGRIVELGFGASVSSRVEHVMIFKKELSLMGTRLQAHKFPEAVAWLENNWERLTDFVTRIYPAEQTEEAFRYVADHGKDVRKVLVEWSWAEQNREFERGIL